MLSKTLLARVSDNMKTVLGYSGLAFVAVVFGRFLRLSTLARGALRPTNILNLYCFV